MTALIASGTVPADAGAVAAFLREHGAALDKTQLGEYFGCPEELPVAAMHAYIDAERYTGLGIDEALRGLLQGFRLPGNRLI